MSNHKNLFKENLMEVNKAWAKIMRDQHETLPPPSPFAKGAAEAAHAEPLDERIERMDQQVKERIARDAAIQAEKDKRNEGIRNELLCLLSFGLSKEESAVYNVISALTDTVVDDVVTNVFLHEFIEYGDRLLADCYREYNATPPRPEYLDEFTELVDHVIARISAWRDAAVEMMDMEVVCYSPMSEEEIAEKE